MKSKLAKVTLGISLFAEALLLQGCAGDFKPVSTLTLPSNAGLDGGGTTVAVDGKTLYANNCAACHGPVATSTKMGRVAQQIQAALSSIPQMKPIQLTTNEISLIAAALAPSQNSAAVTPTEAAAKYFPLPDREKAPKRISRLTRDQLEVTIKTLFSSYPLPSIKNALPADPLITNYEYSEVLNFNAANFAPFKTWLDQVVAAVRANPAGLINCTSMNNSQTCLQTQARAFLVKAFRGDVSEAKLTELTNFYVTAFSKTDLATATGDLVDITLSSPQFLFREEYEISASTAQLVPAEQLQLLTYGLADAPPEKLAMNSLNAASYVSASAQPATINAVLSTPEARAKLSRFFLAWLEVKEASEYNLAPSLFPEFTSQVAASAVNETKKFLNHHVTRPQISLKDITLATQSFVDANLSNIYGVSAADPMGNSLVNLNPAERLGIFSQPAVIASHSGPDTTRPVKRGAFFARKVMCIPIAGTPPDVDTTLPDNRAQTLRQKIEAATNNSRCMSCHSALNPMGFFQERYSASGKWRTTEDGLNVDARINFTSLDEGSLHTDGPVETIKGLSQSMMFQQCFIRQMFRFYMGRAETASDDPVLKEMFLAFTANDKQDVLAALKTLANSSRLNNR